MILVTGATGTIGGEVARQLVAAGQRPRLLVRSPDKAKAYAAQADLVQGDLARPETLAAAMQGVEALFLVTAGVDGRKLEASAIDAAKKAGVRRVVKLSVIGAEQPEFTFAKWHAESERRLMDSGLGWTMLRPGNFMSNALGWAETIKTQGLFYQPSGEGKWAAIDPADIGAVAVKALTTPGHEGKAYTLTGPQSLSAAGYAAQLAEVLARPVKFVDVPPEAARKAMLEGGMPEVEVAAILDLSAYMKANRLDFVRDGVEQVLGRKPTSFIEWARRNAAAFR